MAALSQAVFAGHTVLVEQCFNALNIRSSQAIEAVPLFSLRCCGREQAAKAQEKSAVLSGCAGCEHGD